MSEHLKTIKPWELELNQEAYSSSRSIVKIVNLSEILGKERFGYLTFITEDRNHVGTIHAIADSVEKCKEEIKERRFLDEPLFLCKGDAEIYERIRKEVSERIFLERKNFKEDY